MFALGIVATVFVQGQASFQGIGSLPGGNTGSSISSISSDGNIAVGVSSSPTGNQAIRWQNGVMTALGTLPGGSFSESYDLTNNGSTIVGTSASTLGLEAFVWNGTMSSIGDLPTGPVHSACSAISGDGTVLAGTGSTSLGFEAFRYTGGTMFGLGYLVNTGERKSYARDISEDGVVIVGASTSANSAPGKTEAFVHRIGIMLGLGDLPGGIFESDALGVSGDGDTIVGFSSSANGKEAFRWRNGVMIPLGDLPGGAFESAAFRTNANGDRIIGWSLVSAQYDSFIWDDVNGMRSIRDLLANSFGLAASVHGWNLTYATGIDATGTKIVGWGTNPSGVTEGWIAVLPGKVQISGNISLSSYSASPSGRVATIEICRAGELTVRQTTNVTLDANGSYQLQSYANGSFDIYARSDHFLRRKVASVNVSPTSGASNVNFVLVNGDCDHDNEVTLVDLGLLASVFGLAIGDPGFIASCDLDGDDEVNLLDYSILSNSFGQAGD